LKKQHFNLKEGESIGDNVRFNNKEDKNKNDKSSANNVQEDIGKIEDEIQRQSLNPAERKVLKEDYPRVDLTDEATPNYFKDWLFQDDTSENSKYKYKNKIENLSISKLKPNV